MEDEPKKKSITGIVVVLYGILLAGVVICIIVNGLKYPEIKNAFMAMSHGEPIGYYGLLCVMFGVFAAHFDTSIDNWIDERKQGRINKKPKKVTT